MLLNNSTYKLYSNYKEKTGFDSDDNFVAHLIETVSKRDNAHLVKGIVL